MGDKKQGDTLPGFSRQSMSELNDDENKFVNSVNNGEGASGNNIAVGLKVYSFNAQSICNTILEFKENIYFYKPKIIGICESWLHDDVPEGDINVLSKTEVEEEVLCCMWAMN